MTQYLSETAPRIWKKSLLELHQNNPKPKETQIGQWWCEALVKQPDTWHSGPDQGLWTQKASSEFHLKHLVDR